MSSVMVTSAHLERDAYLYIRQSTPHQVIENTESTLRQYALRERAVAYGWPLERIHVIDNDLGKSGATAQQRDGFQELVSEVALGKAGIVMGLEVSRLARNSADWHRLIELCSMTGTLILDQDGTYDPACFNDRLVLGLKGTMSEAELHIIRSRMRGGILNKARRAELGMNTAVGLVYQDNGVLGLDPDASVQAAIRWVFDTFEQTGSALKTVRKMIDAGLRLPLRQRVGEKKGDLTWTVPTHCRVLQLLRNPRYAGAFVYGRSRARRLPNGGMSVKRLPLAEWQFVFPQSHAGYISWDQFLANQQRLQNNSKFFGNERSAGPAREGPALLQGIALCGVCGAHMTIQYKHVSDRLLPIYVCQQDAVRRGHNICQKIGGVALDQAIGELILGLMAPMSMDIALAVQQEIDSRIEETNELRRTQVERARYEAELARRRYMKADPDNRLVVSSLEADWNEKLRLHLEAQEEYEQQAETGLLINMDTRKQLLTLVEDFPHIWNDPAVDPRERKRILRLLIEDVTLIKSDVITAHVRLRGGATRTLTLPVALPFWMLRKTPAAVVSLIDELLDAHSEAEIPRILYERGHRTYRQTPYTVEGITRICVIYNLKSRRVRLLEQGFANTEELRRRIGVSQSTIKRWRREDRLPRKHYGERSRCLYGSPENLSELKSHLGQSVYADNTTPTQTHQ